MGESGAPVDPCAEVAPPTPAVPNVRAATVNADVVWVNSDHDARQVSGRNWFVEIRLEGQPLEPGTYVLPATKKECWWGDTDGACDLWCDDVLEVEIVKVTDTCVAARVAQADPDELPCAEFDSEPFVEIVDMSGGFVAERLD